jgi:hypothetical protein
MRGVQVQVPEQAKAKLDLLTVLRDSALDASRSCQQRLNMVDGNADLQARLAAERDKHAQRHNHSHRLLSACNQYLFQLRLPPGYVLESAPPPDIAIKTTTAKAIEATRRNITEVVSEIARTRALALKQSSKQAAMRSLLVRLALAARPRIDFAQDGSARITWPENLATMDSVAGLLALLFPQELTEAFQLDAEPEPENAVSPEERDQQISKFANTLLQLERQEEFLIERAADEGTEIVRRRDTNPMAVLQLQIVAQEAATASAA